MTDKKSLGDLARTAREQGTPEIDLAALDNHNTIIVDVRESDERAKGYIPGSIALPRGIIERDFEKKVIAQQPDPNNPPKIVCYCGGGSRSLLAVKTLHEMGYDNAVSLTGGFRAWSLANKEIAKD